MNGKTVRARCYRAVGGKLLYLMTSDEGEIRLPWPDSRYEWATDEFSLDVYLREQEAA